MYKFLMWLVFSMLTPLVYGQTDPLTREEQRMLDSMFNSDEFVKLFMNRSRSYVDVNTGMGNRIFSLRNNALNAGQALTNKIFYTPSAGYFHKNGFAVSVSGFAAPDNGSLKMYQYAISPSYTYSSKNIVAGISYTRFIEGSQAGFETSPFTNDFYTSFQYKKTWLEPGIAFGFSFGKQVEYYDSSFWYTPPLPADPRIVHIRDTITTRLTGLSLTLSAGHTWSFWELINDKDGIQVQPVLMLNAGSQRWNTEHSSRLFNHFPRLANFLKRRFGDGSGSKKFKLQSAALSAKLTYFYGKFYLQPQLYLDYYLPATTEKRLTPLYSITAGVTLY